MPEMDGRTFSALCVLLEGGSWYEQKNPPDWRCLFCGAGGTHGKDCAVEALESWVGQHANPALRFTVWPPRTTEEGF